MTETRPLHGVRFVSLEVWGAFLEDHPEAHLLQTREWAQLKMAFGWRAAPVIAEDSGALILFRPLPLGFHVAYIPKGPVGPWTPALLRGVDVLARRHRALFLLVEPDAWEEDEATPPPGFRKGACPVQPPRTLVVDLTPSEEDILARMKQKTRYNIRLAMRKGVRVRPWADVEGFYAMLVETARRDGFAIHPPAYYRWAYNLFVPRGMATLLVAEYQGEPLAALMVFARGSRAWYFYGASTGRHRNRMPTYLLQWEAMRWAKARGCREYDLWGVPDEDLETLERDFTRRRDGLWGVYRFKRGFGGRLRRAAGPWVREYIPGSAWLYRMLRKCG